GTAVDRSTEPHGWTNARIKAARMALPFVDTFFGNEVEVAALGGKSSPFEAAMRILELGAGEVVVHRGNRGSARIAPNGITKMRAFSVPVENPTGCVDVFIASYIYARLIADPTSAALRFATAASALHVRDRRRPYPTL